jgi:hypothetical protein
MSDQTPTHELPPAPGWKKVTPQTRFQEGEFYVLLARAVEPFVAAWHDGDGGGLIDLPQGYSEWSGRGDRSAALFYHQLPPLPPEALAVIGGMWADYYRRGEQRRQEGGG